MPFSRIVIQAHSLSLMTEPSLRRLFRPDAPQTSKRSRFQETSATVERHGDIISRKDDAPLEVLKPHLGDWVGGR